MFCGRRPLAGTYAGGEVITSQLPARPWLRLHRVSAFSVAEAHTYLQRTGVPERLVVPILSRSVAAASSSVLGLPAEVEPRYSPFSLSVYAAWIARQGDVEPDAILGDPVDHFVRIRILDRIHNADVRRLLPHVALLGRFDEPTLRACADLRAEVADAVLREIGSQEWIDRQPGGSYAVEPELRSRLLRYFERESPRELHEARRRVLPVLWTSYEAGTDDRVPDEAVVQALVQLVREDRDGLLRAWRTLDGRIVLGAQAGWGLRVLGRLLADDIALTSDAVDAGAWGAFATTYAECVLHEQGAAQAGDLWRNAWEAAQHVEEPHERASLLVRIASGALAAAAAAPDTEVAFDLWTLRLYNLVGDRTVSVTAPLQDVPLGHRRKPVHAAIAALMACADAAERHPDPLEPAPALLERIATLVVDVRHAPARAIVLTCIGRFASRRQDADLARKRFVDALQTLAESADRDLLPCLQWPKRLDAASWVTLEAMRGLAGLEPVEETLERFAALPTPRREIAINRLESLRLRLTAAVRVPHESSGSPSRKGSSIGVGDVAVPESLGHELVRPRAVSIALDHVECGRPAEGLRLLAELTSVATSARNTTVATAVERTRIEAVTRMRLGEHGRLSRQLVSGAGLLPLAERARMRAFVPDANAAAFDDEMVATRWDAHCVWRAMRATGHRQQQHLGEAGRRLLTLRDKDGEGEWARASVALDLVECSELGADADLASQGLSPVSPEDWWSRHPAQPERALRVWIRSAALGVSPGGPTSLLVRRLGVRRAAAIAMEEGELLALRLPAQALRLLALSLTWYEDAHDALGIWQVTTLLALTRVRAGVPRDSIDLTALQAAHHPLVVAGTDRGSHTLPPWSWVEAVTQLPLSDSAATIEWAPWLHRVIALRHWVSGGVRPEVLFTTPEWLPVELREWPLDTLGGAAVSTSETRLAAAPGGHESEVPPPPVPVPTMAPRPLPPPSMPPRLESTSVPVPVQAPLAVATSRAPWLLVGLVALLGILVVAGWLSLRPPPAPALPAGSDVPGPNAGGAVAEGAPPLVVWLGMIAALASLGAGGWLFLRLRTTPSRALLASPPWTAQVSATGSDVAGGRLAALDVTVSIATGRGEPVTTASLRVRRTDAYSGLDALRQPPSGTALAVAFASSPAPTRLWLEVALGTAWPCWEALLWSGVVDGTHLRPAVVRHVRSSRPARQVSPDGAARPWPVATVAATAGDERQAAYAWEPSLRAGRVTLTPVAAEAVRAGVPVQGIRLVHVTAQPVETPQGLFFEVAGGDRLQVQESLESMSSDRGTLFDASQLAHTFPDATCLLLQPPRRPALDLTPAGRETCACLRVVAAALAEQGVPLVIVMPPLDGELAAHIVRLLGRRILHLRGGALDPHEFTIRVREVVLGHAQRLLPRDAAIELALQVGVYAL